jgi:hypothetical protein
VLAVDIFNSCMDGMVKRSDVAEGLMGEVMGPGAVRQGGARRNGLPNA